MGVRITDSLKKKILVALVAAGISGPSAYVATQLTVPSEGFELVVYADPVGLPTVCIGHMDKKLVVGTKVTEEYCVRTFVEDWNKHEKLLNGVVKVDYKSEWMYGALTDFTFNKGIGNVQSSTLLKLLNNKKYDQACEQLSRWVYAKKNGVAVVLPGLVIRASKQYSYCMGIEPADYKQTMSRYLE
jgi:lysozyme